MGCLVLAVSSASYGSSTKRRAIFLKIAKPNHINIVIFRKHFSHSLRNIYDLISLSFGILIHFTYLLSFGHNKVSSKSFSIFLKFLMHFLILSGTNFIININYGV